ncbi:MAG: hypothetical protein P8177_06235 [Gemmatimonadota bacterium]
MTVTCFESRSWISSTALRRLPDSPRRTAMSPAMRIIHPMTGIRKIASFESHFISHGRCERRKMSAKDSWFATATYGRRGSSMTTPSVEKRQNGTSFTAATAARRNQRPAA